MRLFKYGLCILIIIPVLLGVVFLSVKAFKEEEAENEPQIPSPGVILVVNCWTTSCGPCIKEMPLLEELSKEYEAKGVKLVGMICDYEEGNDEYAKVLNGILNETKVTYEMQVPDEAFIKACFPMLNNTFPGTFVFGENGELLTFVSGALDRDEWIKLFDSFL